MLNQVIWNYKEKVHHYLKDEYINPKYLIDRRWRRIEYREITLDYFLNNGYKQLFRIKEVRMTGLQKLRIRQILHEYDPHGYLTMAWVNKEKFLEWLDNLDIDMIREVRRDCLESEHYQIRWFGRTLERWDKQLENYCKYSTQDFKFTNAVTESLNNQCKVAKRVSMWFRHKNNYKRKLASRFCSKFKS